MVGFGQWWNEGSGGVRVVVGEVSRGEGEL